VVLSPKAVLYNSQTLALWARLVLTLEAGSRSFPLSMESQTLGRSSKNDIVISDPVVSTFHARIDRTPDGFNIVDLTSTNGTFLNGKRITTAILEPRDEVRFGGVKLVYLEE
jgi:pSer/pThr/pTyr-binding forkhead associated (FHA) protein